MHLSLLLLLLYFCFTIDGLLIPHTSQLSCLYISRYHHLISSSNVIVLPVTATAVHHRTRSPLYYRSTQAPEVLKGSSFSRLSLFSDEETIEFSSSVQFLLKAALLGAITGFTVHLFKYLISLELTLFYENLAAVLPKPVLYWPFIICKHSLLSDLLLVITLSIITYDRSGLRLTWCISSSILERRCIEQWSGLHCEELSLPTTSACRT